MTTEQTGDSTSTDAKLAGGEWVAGARPATATSGVSGDAVFEYLLRLGDDRLILGHRLSEWCGHAPILEEDIALANVALDLIGQSAMLLTLAGAREGKGRSDDALAFFRDTIEFRNCLLVELPKGDFAVTTVRQMLFDAWDVLLCESLVASTAGTSDAMLEQLGGVAGKALKESKYHLRHSTEWVRRLGDGTAESHARAQRALDRLWPYTSELFARDVVDDAVIALGAGVDAAALRPRWLETVQRVAQEATLTLPHGGEPGPFQATGGRIGRHTEHLGHLLAEMQIVARSHPGASW